MSLMPQAVAPVSRDPKALAATIAALAARFGNRLVTSQAVREQHGNTTTWIANEPPDAVVFPQSPADVQEIVRICATHGVPVIPFGTGTSLEGHVNAPQGGVSIDFRDMNRMLAVHAEDFDCVAEPGITRKGLNEHLRDALQVKAGKAESRLARPETPRRFVGFHGSGAGVAGQSQRFGEIAGDLGGGPFDWATRLEDRTRLWQARHDAYWAGRMLKPGAQAFATDVCVPISRLADCVV